MIKAHLLRLVNVGGLVKMVQLLDTIFRNLHYYADCSSIRDSASSGTLVSADLPWELCEWKRAGECSTL